MESRDTAETDSGRQRGIASYLANMDGSKTHTNTYAQLWCGLGSDVPPVRRKGSLPVSIGKLSRF